MIVKTQDLIDLMEESINDDTIIVENYTKVIGVLDVINKEQAVGIFDSLVSNHYESEKWTRRFEAKSKLFANQAKKSGGGVNPAELSKLESLQTQAEAISEKRSELELKIGKTMLEKNFIDEKTYKKYYPE